MNGESKGKQFGEVGVEDGPTTPSLKLLGTEKRGRGRPRKTAPGEKYHRKPQVYRSEVFRLTETDLEVFEWLAVHRWSTREMLVEEFYSQPDRKRLKDGVKPSGAYGIQRITKLVRSGYIEPSKFRIGSMAPLLLSKTGYGILHGMGRVEWAHHLDEIDPATIEHERLCQTLRIRLQALGATNWQTERCLSWENRVKGLKFVSDAQFEAGGYLWCLEVERRLKSKDRRENAFKVRADASTHVRFLYVVPKTILGALRESMKFKSFELGLYIWREEVFREGATSVESTFPLETTSQRLEDLLRGGFEGPIAEKQKAKIQSEALDDLRKIILKFSSEVVAHIDRQTAKMDEYLRSLETRRKGVLGIGADKINPPKFVSSSIAQFEEKFGTVTMKRREWRTKHAVEVESVKAIEIAFEAYVKELKAIDREIDKHVAEKHLPPAYKLSKAQDLRTKLQALR